MTIRRIVFMRSVGSDAAASNRVFGDDPVRDCFGAAGFQVDHRVMKMTVAAKFADLLFDNLEFDKHAVLHHFLDPGAHQKLLADAERPLEFEMTGADVPAETGPRELLHRHL